MIYIRSTYILQAIGLGISIWQLIFGLPMPVTFLGILLLLSPLFVTKNEMLRNGFLLLISGVGVLVTSVSVHLYIMWPVAGLFLIGIGARVVIGAIRNK